MGRMKQEEDDVESERRLKRATPDWREIGKGKEMATLQDAQGRGRLETCAANGVGKRGQAVTVGEHMGSSSVGGRVLSGEVVSLPGGRKGCVELLWAHTAHRCSQRTSPDSFDLWRISDPQRASQSSCELGFLQQRVCALSP